MLTIDEILTKAELITLETQLDSITPARVGELFASLAEQLRLGVGGGVSIGASKLSELSDVMLLNNKDNDILQKIGTKWTNIQLDVNKINQIANFWKVDELGNLYTDLNLYSKSGVAAYGAGPDGEGGATAYDRLDAWSVYTAEKSGWVLSAFLGNDLNARVIALEAGGSGGSTVAFGAASGGYIPLTVDGVTNGLALSTHQHTWSAITDKPSTFTPSAHSHLWADLTDKPSTFAPSAHTHLWADMTDKPTTFAPSAHTHLWADLTDKPTTFTPSAHTHTKSQIVDFAHTHLWADITDKPSTFAPSAHTHLWANITDKPATFTPSAHTHTKSQIIDFGHTHLWSELTDKPTTFAPSAHTHLWANITDKPATFTPSTHTHAFADLTSKPTTLSGYGITDALLSSAYTASDVLTKIKTVDGTGSGLDADLLDGFHAGGASGNWWSKIPVVGADGVMEVGKFFDFHETNTGTTDYDGRISSELGVVKWNGYTMYHAGNSNKSDVNWTANTLSANTDVTISSLASTDKSVKTFINKFNSMFDIDAQGLIYAKTDFYSVGGVSAYGLGTSSGPILNADMNANGHNITGVQNIYAGNAYLGNAGINPSLQWNYDGDENTMAEYRVLTGEYYYAGNQVKYGGGILAVTGKVDATEFKFGRYKFMEDTNGDLGIYNGTTKIATILKTRTNSNL